jgi:5-enolpyruvylshikimate-3-phosphate synthase
MTPTYTYDPDTAIGRVRRLIGDRDIANALLSDEEIQSWLTDNGGDTSAASVRILRSLSAEFARKATLSSGNEKIEYRHTAASMLEAADTIEAQESGTARRIMTAKLTRRPVSDSGGLNTGGIT